jgi:hypothetical protein
MLLNPPLIIVFALFCGVTVSTARHILRRALSEEHADLQYSNRPRETKNTY